jgi:hypothetical protein
MRVTLRDPAAEHAVIRGIAVDTGAAAVRDAAGRLQEQQTCFGGGEDDSPTASCLFHEVFVVFFRLEAEQRQGEVLLPTRLAVAAAGVAAELREQGDDLVGEAYLWFVGQAGDLHLDLGGLAVEHGTKGRFALRSRDQPTAGMDGHDASGLGGQRGGAGQVARFAVGRLARHDDLPPTIGADQFEDRVLRVALNAEGVHSWLSRCGDGKDERRQRDNEPACHGSDPGDREERLRRTDCESVRKLPNAFTICPTYTVVQFL